MSPQSWGPQINPLPLSFSTDFHPAIYDAARDRLLVVGGCGPYCKGVPIYCGASVRVLSRSGAPEWSDLTGFGQTPLGPVFKMVYDSLRDRLVTFEAGDGPGILFVRALYPTTQEWVLLAPDGGSPNILPIAVAYDPVNDRAVLVGAYATNLLTWSGQSAVPETGRERRYLNGGNPNPLRTRTTIELTLPRDERVTVVVYDIAGRLVRDLFSGAITAGSHAVAWDGRDASGTQAANGVYFVELSHSGGSETRRVVRVPD